MAGTVADDSGAFNLGASASAPSSPQSASQSGGLIGTTTPLASAL